MFSEIIAIQNHPNFSIITNKYIVFRIFRKLIPRNLHAKLLHNCTSRHIFVLYFFLYLRKNPKKRRIFRRCYYPSGIFFAIDVVYSKALAWSCWLCWYFSVVQKSQPITPTLCPNKSNNMYNRISFHFHCPFFFWFGFCVQKWIFFCLQWNWFIHRQQMFSNVCVCVSYEIRFPFAHTFQWHVSTICAVQMVIVSTTLYGNRMLFYPAQESISLALALFSVSSISSLKMHICIRISFSLHARTYTATIQQITMNTTSESSEKREKKPN